MSEQGLPASETSGEDDATDSMHTSLQPDESIEAGAALEVSDEDALAGEDLAADDRLIGAAARGPVSVEQLPRVLEAVLLASDRPVSLDQLQILLGEGSGIDRQGLRDGLARLDAECAGRSFMLKETASGYRLQVRQDYAPWILGMREEKPPRFSRAALETLALIAYRQPVTRGDVENVRGVAVSSNIIRMLEEREWIRVVGHKDVPGRPALYATTRQFLDYFNLKSLGDLPTLAELRDLDAIAAEIQGADVDDSPVDLNAVMDLDALSQSEREAGMYHAPGDAVEPVAERPAGEIHVHAGDSDAADACEEPAEVTELAGSDEDDASGSRD